MSVQLARLIEEKLDKLYSREMVVKLSQRNTDEYSRGVVYGKAEVLMELLREIENNEKS